jgi:glycosyltransferase involved in cell wall biosynthesis
MPLVSIAIPTYNRAAGFLRQALGSALRQTYQNIEVIVADNCSSDGTPAMVASIADSRLRYFRHEVNLGPSRNCDFCLAQAKGEYILILHDDDFVDDDFVEQCMKAARYRSGIGIIRTGVRVVNADGGLISEARNLAGGLSTEAFFRFWFARKTSWYLCCTLFHTKGLRAIGGLRSKHFLFDDAMAMVQLASRSGRADIEDVKATFRRHHQRDWLTPTDIAHWCEDSQLLLDRMCELVPEANGPVRREGAQFLAGLCYARAAAVKSPLTRIRCYWVVFKGFHYRFAPPVWRYFVRAPFRRLALRLYRLSPKIFSMRRD